MSSCHREPYRVTGAAGEVETIPALFEAAVTANPAKAWMVFEDREYTYAETHRQVGRAAAALADLGLRPGDVVMATMPSTPEHVFLWLASAHAGTILLTANPRPSDAELAGLVDQVSPAVMSPPVRSRSARCSSGRATSRPSLRAGRCGRV